jgi:glutathione synthase/RimK-type ligase-like ATP-grasp enzyme
VIALGYERTSQRAKELYVVVGGILAAIYIWRRYKAEFGDEKGQGGAGEERKIE